MKVLWKMVKCGSQMVVIANYKLWLIKTIKLLKFIKIIEKILNKKINKIFIKKQDGDVIKTYGNNKKLKKLIKIKKFVKIEEGMKKFIKWYMDYHV